MKTIFVWMALMGGCSSAAVKAKPTDPMPGEPLSVTMGRRPPVRVRVARGQATLIRLAEGQRVMNTYGGDKGEGGVWSVDAGKVPTRYLAVKPKEIGIQVRCRSRRGRRFRQQRSRSAIYQMGSR